MYEKLKQYKTAHGDCLVPRQWKKDKRLGEWVTDQRRQYKYKTNNKPTLLTAQREKKLNEIEFTWSLRNRLDWNERYQELVKFKQENGHCIVPQLYTKVKGLGKWVSKQREQYKNLVDGKYSFITEERIEQLDAIGFSWNAKGRRSAESLMGCNVLKPQAAVSVEGANDSSASAGMSTVAVSAAAAVATTSDGRGAQFPEQWEKRIEKLETHKSTSSATIQKIDDMNSDISYDTM